MERNRTLALIVAYYLSKFNEIAYEKLGFENMTITHKEVGRILGVKPNTVKNMRDEFDSIHDNPREGWYHRPLRPSRVKVVELFQDLEEEELYGCVSEILDNTEFISNDEFSDVVSSISKVKKYRKVNQFFSSRGITGRKAEEEFMIFHERNGLPVPGKLEDTRDHGCGYDFAIITPDNKIKIEVKGLDGFSGGVSFTNKEWETAKSDGENYYLVLVRNVSSTPEFQIIQNPYYSLSPKRSIITTVQTRWNVSENQFRD